MRKLSIGLAIAATLLMSCTALAQGKMDHMQGHKMSGKMKGHMMSKADQKVVACMMTGLTPDEKKVAHEHMMKMSKAEVAVMMKRGRLCMADPHTALKNMKGQPTEKQVHDHMMSGLTKSEQTTMDGMMSKMTAKEKVVCMKAVENCCMYGMKHAK